MPDVITGPGWYRTRDGQRVEIVSKLRGGYWAGYMPGMADCSPGRWSSEGHSRLDKAEATEDIIGPWTDFEETVCVAVFRCGDNLLTKVIDADDSETTGEVGRAIVKLKGGA